MGNLHTAAGYRAARDAMPRWERRVLLLAARDCLVEHGHQWAAGFVGAMAAGIPDADRAKPPPPSDAEEAPRCLTTPP